MSTKEAFADAISGVIGSLLSMAVFYPIDVIKTNVQVTTTNKSLTETTIQQQQQTKHKNIFTVLYITKLFKGIHYKAAHTITSSFTYFFIYSFVQSQHRNYYQRTTYCKQRSQKNANIQNINDTTRVYQPSTSTRLFLSAIAAIMNTLITLPLDVISSRSQLNHHHHHHEKQNDLYSDGNSNNDRNNIDCVYDVDRDMKQPLENNVESQLLDNSLQYSTSSSHIEHPTSNNQLNQPQVSNNIIIMNQVWNSECDQGMFNNHTKSNTVVTQEELNDYNIDNHNIYSQESFHSAQEVEENGTVAIQKSPIGTKSPNLIDNPIENQSSCSNKKKKESIIPKKINPFFRLDTMTHPLPPHDILEQSNKMNNIYIKSNTNTIKSQHLNTNSQRIQKWSGLWQGLWPSILLCSNPSIHFTVYDTLKEAMLRYKQSKTLQLSIVEAFLIGIISKFAATMVTYPLIRAKVLLMCSSPPTSRSSNDQQNRGYELDTRTNKMSMMNTLKQIIQNEGLLGLYKGCGLQLFHTLLKSALLMTVRERIDSRIRHLLIK